MLGLLRGEQIEFDAGVDIRDFMHIEDIASAIAALVERQFDGAVNVASGEPLSVRAVIEEIALHLRVQARVVFGAPSEPRLSPLVSLLRSVICGRLRNGHRRQLLLSELPRPVNTGGRA